MGQDEKLDDILETIVDNFANKGVVHVLYFAMVPLVSRIRYSMWICRAFLCFITSLL